MIQTNGKTYPLMDWKNIVKMTILLKAIYRFSAVLIKIPVTFFTEQIILIFVWKYQKLQIVKTVLRKKNKAGDITVPDFF